MAPVRTLIADGHRMFAEALGRALAVQPDIDVIDDFPATGIEAAAATAAQRPDVVLLDQWIPGMAAPATIASVGERSPRTRVVVLSWLSSEADRRAAESAGALAFVGKEQDVAAVVDALRRVTVQDHQPQDRSLPQPTRPNVLTARELEVLKLLSVEGHRARVAETLALSHGTVRIHIQSIMRKLDARSQLEAVAVARHRGLIAPGHRSMSDRSQPTDAAPILTDLTRVLVVDAQRLFAEAVGDALAHEPWFVVVPEVAQSPDEALYAASSKAPDVIVLDYWFPGAQGAELTAALLTAAPTARVLVLSWLVAPDHVRECLRAGAAGFLLKQASLVRLVDGVRRAARGDPLVFGEELAGMLKGLDDSLDAGRAAREQLQKTLSPREVQVLRLVGIGRTPADIARVLGIRLATVKVHMRALRTKVGVGSVAEAVAVAERCGFIPVL